MEQLDAEKFLMLATPLLDYLDTHGSDGDFGEQVYEPLLKAVRAAQAELVLFT